MGGEDIRRLLALAMLFRVLSVICCTDAPCWFLPWLACFNVLACVRLCCSGELKFIISAWDPEALLFWSPDVFCFLALPLETNFQAVRLMVGWASWMWERKCWGWRVVSYSLSESEGEAPAALSITKANSLWLLVLNQETGESEENLTLSQKTNWIRSLKSC